MLEPAREIIADEQAEVMALRVLHSQARLRVIERHGKAGRETQAETAGAPFRRRRPTMFSSWKYG